MVVARALVMSFEAREERRVYTPPLDVRYWTQLRLRLKIVNMPSPGIVLQQGGAFRAMKRLRVLHLADVNVRDADMV